MFLIVKFNSLLSFIHLNIPFLIGARPSIMAPRVVSSKSLFLSTEKFSTSLLFSRSYNYHAHHVIFQKPRSRVSEKK